MQQYGDLAFFPPIKAPLIGIRLYALKGLHSAVYSYTALLNAL